MRSGLGVNAALVTPLGGVANATLAGRVKLVTVCQFVRIIPAKPADKRIVFAADEAIVAAMSDAVFVPATNPTNGCSLKRRADRGAVAAVFNRGRT